MFKMVFTSVAIALACCGCSKTDEQSTHINTPVAKAPDSANDAGSNLSNPASESTQDPGNVAKDTTQKAHVPAEERTKSTGKAPAAPAPKTKERHSKDATSEWAKFRADLSKCDSLDGAEKEQCTAAARDAYRAAGFQCDTLLEPDRKACLKYAEQWNKSVVNPSKAAITHTTTPTITPATPGDSRPAERNRDSTKQQEDSVGGLAEPVKTN